MSSLSKGFLPVLLASAALVGCGRQEPVTADDAYKNVKETCAVGDSFACVASVNRATSLYMDKAKVDAATKQAITSACTVPDREMAKSADIELAIQSRGAMTCLSKIFDVVPDDDTNVKLNAGLTRLNLLSNINTRARTARMGG